MDDRLIRNYNRRKTTTNRYVTDSNAYWREELHPRIEYLHETILGDAQTIIEKRVADNVWGFPVDVKNVTNVRDVFMSITEDYFNFVRGRRTWVYTETDGYWTEDRIADTITHAFIIALWDIGRLLLIQYYPLIWEDLSVRSGKTFINDERESYHDSLNRLNTADKQETYHDSVNKLNTADKKYTQHDNTRNKIMEENNGVGSDTTNGRSTSNSTTIQDTFLSPQNQGVTPSSQSESVMGRSEGFQTPDNMGVEEVVPNGNPSFTTATVNTFEGDTSTNEEGRTSTSKDFHNRVDERDYLEGNETTQSGVESENNVGGKTENQSEIQGDNNVGAKTRNDSGHERQEVLDIGDMLKKLYDLLEDRLIVELDNRMLPYYLNMKIARFKDHRIGRNHYE